MPVVFLVLCSELHLAHVNGARDDPVHELTVTRTCRNTHIHITFRMSCLRKLMETATDGGLKPLRSDNADEPPEPICCTSLKLVFSWLLSQVTK